MKLSQLKKSLLPIIGFGLLTPVVYAVPLPPPDIDVTSNDEVTSFPLMPRLSITGLAGSDFTGSGDGIVPLIGDANQIWYTDVQGRYGEEGTWMGSIGTGYRRVVNNARILGGYVFVDHDESQRGNQYWLVSPGLESMGNDWDFRVNGYIPVSDRNKNEGTVFASDFGDCNFVNFTGHQEFDHLLDLTEEVGAGFDGEIGRVIPFLAQTRAYVGGYHFQFKNSKDMNGVSGRLEIPTMPHVALIASDNYDNIQHNTVLVGLRFSVGGFSSERTPADIEERILDPITRGLGAQNNGTGVPIILATHDEGANVLYRDNIYFFTANGGTAFNAANGNVNCTFEHPCTGGSWSQNTVDAINGFAPNTNFYFNGGTYTNQQADNTPPTPANFMLQLHNGQSMYGRTADYKCSANGNDRSLFLGGFDLLEGNNLIDSIRVLNSFTGTGGANVNITALNIQNAPNIHLNNDDIRAEAIVNGNLSGGFLNAASGIYANGSQVWIDSSSISALASVSGTNGFANYATGIGGNTLGTSSANFTNNLFVINNSTISGTTSVTTGSGASSAAGIGGNSGGSGTQGADFTGNIFTINNSQVTGTAAVSGVNSVANFATGIGGNTVDGTTTQFLNNVFNISNSIVSGTAAVGGNNTSGNAANFATGIGGNMWNSTSAVFDSNTFTIENSNVSGTASVGGSNINTANNFANGIGGNVFSSGDASFNGNTFTIDDSAIAGTAAIAGDNNNTNFVTGIGGNALGGNTDFTNDNFTISHSSVSGTAAVGGDNTVANVATGIGGNATGSANFTNDNFVIDDSVISGTASIAGNNSDFNDVTGIGGTAGGSANFTNDNFILNNTVVNGAGLIGGNNTGTNFAYGIGGNGSALFTNDIFTINNSQINVNATVTGSNTGTNTATGFKADSGSTFTLNNSTGNVTASAAGGTNTAIATAGTGTVILQNGSVIHTSP